MKLYQSNLITRSHLQILLFNYSSEEAYRHKNIFHKKKCNMIMKMSGRILLQLKLISWAPRAENYRN